MIYKPWKNEQFQGLARWRSCPSLETVASRFTHPFPTNSHWPTSMTDSVLVSHNTFSLAWVFILSCLKSSNWIKRPTNLSNMHQLEVCRKPTNPPNLTRPNPTRRVGSVFKAWWVELGYKFFFNSGSGWV